MTTVQSLRKRVDKLQQEAGTGDNDLVTVEVVKANGEPGTHTMTRREYRQGHGDDFIIIFERTDDDNQD